MLGKSETVRLVRCCRANGNGSTHLALEQIPVGLRLVELLPQGGELHVVAGLLLRQTFVVLNLKRTIDRDVRLSLVNRGCKR